MSFTRGLRYCRYVVEYSDLLNANRRKRYAVYILTSITLPELYNKSLLIEGQVATF